MQSIPAWFNKIPDMLIKEGFAELTQQYKGLDIDNIQDFSIGLEKRIKELQQYEKDAKYNMRGPLWSKYKSEFVKDMKRQNLKMFKEAMIMKISNFFKR